MKKPSRRSFVRSVSMIGIGVTMTDVFGLMADKKLDKIPVGMVGMDTSHSPALVRAINNSEKYRVTTAFTTVSVDFPLSVDRVGKFTKEIKDMGVEVVPTLDGLLDKVDCVLLCTVDPRLHLKQAEQILQSGKRVFIDKPMAASLKDVVRIFDMSKKYGVPTFTSSSLRFMGSAVGIRNGGTGRIDGADVFGPISYQAIFPELYWYGIHGIELLYTVMGPGCQKVRRLTTAKSDLITGVWAEGRVGNYRGLKNRKVNFGGQVFTDKEMVVMDDYKGLEPLHRAILEYFDTGELPVEPRETVEIFAFMEAAHESGKRNGKWIFIDEVLDGAMSYR